MANRAIEVLSNFSLMTKRGEVKNYLWSVLVFATGLALIFILPIGDYGREAGLSGKLVIDFGNGQTRVFSGEVVPSTTFLVALYSSSVQGGFGFRYVADDAGNIKVYSIQDVVNKGWDGTWHFYLNHHRVLESNLGRTDLRGGDVAEAKFQK